MKMNGSEILTHVLIEQGVDTVFGYPGGAVLNIYDALYKNQDKIHHYITAHEQGAAHAADGYARATGKTGVVIATSGPGATNLVTGIATAFMDSIPMVAITGNVGRSLIGKDSFQEVYTVGITMPITKHNYVIQSVEELADVLREAFRIANSGRKGPVLVDIPKDITAALCEFESGEKYVEPKAEFTNEKTLKKIGEYLNQSKKPIICFGGGVINSGASNELYEFIHKTEIPACYTMMGTGVISHDDPYSLGLLGMHGTISSNRAVKNADLLIAIGTRFSDRVALNADKFAADAKVIQIDIDQSEFKKNIHVDLSVLGDIKSVLEKLLSNAKKAGHDRWMEEITSWKKLDYKPKDDENSIKPHQLIESISDIAGDDSVIVTDVGQHQVWAAQYCHRTKPRSFITSGGLGTMGFGYGAAIGAKIAMGEDTPVIHITGDGSFHMNLNEACTAVSYNIPVITVIMNNQVLGMVRQWQTAFYDKRYSSTTLERKTDYVKLAEAFGGKGYRCSSIGEFRDVLAQAIKDKSGPVWIECQIDRDEKVLPMIPSGGTVEDTILD